MPSITSTPMVSVTLPEQQLVENPAVGANSVIIDVTPTVSPIKQRKYSRSGNKEAVSGNEPFPSQQVLQQVPSTRNKPSPPSKPKIVDLSMLSLASLRAYRKIHKLDLKSNASKGALVEAAQHHFDKELLQKIPSIGGRRPNSGTFTSKQEQSIISLFVETVKRQREGKTESLDESAGSTPSSVEEKSSRYANRKRRGTITQASNNPINNTSRSRRQTVNCQSIEVNTQSKSYNVSSGKGYSKRRGLIGMAASTQQPQSVPPSSSITSTPSKKRTVNRRGVKHE